MERLEAGAPFASCLAGARLGFDGARLVLAREARDRRTGSSADVRLEPGCPTVWDGRFEITVPEDGWSAGFVGGRSARLSRRDAAALRRAHSSARGAAPMLLDPDGNARLPAPGAGLGATARSLVGNRLAAACGSLQHESAIATWRNACAHPKSSREASEEAVDEPS
jgi:tRNA(Ile)-lysidine synthase